MPENANPPAAPLNDERKRELIEKWWAVLSGKAEPEYLTFPPKIMAMVEAAERELPIRIAPAAHRRLLEDYALSYLYRGALVVRLDLPRGCVVLAAGHEEWYLLMESIPIEQRRAARPMYTLPWDDTEALK